MERFKHKKVSFVMKSYYDKNILSIIHLPYEVIYWVIFTLYFILLYFILLRFTLFYFISLYFTLLYFTFLHLSWFIWTSHLIDVKSDYNYIYHITSSILFSPTFSPSASSHHPHLSWISFIFTSLIPYFLTTFF